MKYSFTLRLMVAVALVACCSSAPHFRATVMENEKVLDNFDQIILRWTILDDTDIEMEIQANCTGWIGIALAHGRLGEPGSYGDIIMGGYDDETGEGYIEDRWIDLSVAEPSNGGDFDTNPDVLLLDASYQEPWSIIRIKRNLDTQDPQDIAIVPGPMLVSWTYATFDNTSIPHDTPNTGFALVTFIPARQPTSAPLN